MVTTGGSDIGNNNNAFHREEDFITERPLEDLNYTGLVNLTSSEPELTSSDLSTVIFRVAVLIMAPSVCANMSLYLYTIYR